MESHPFKPMSDDARHNGPCAVCGYPSDSTRHQGAVWTTEKPTENGYYWVRKYVSTDVILEVHPHTNILFEHGENEVLALDEVLRENPNIQWQGPLKPQE